MNELFTWDSNNKGVGLLMDYIHRASMVCGWEGITNECSKMAHKARKDYDEEMGYGGVDKSGMELMRKCALQKFTVPLDYIGDDKDYDYTLHQSRNFPTDNELLKAHQEEW